uniref:DUF4781 domain-containing protein n=1 Tax=Anopheles dirus TaxID=7168 RepID=A0A182N612_9DIPT
MSQYHVSQIMHHFLQRGVELEQGELIRCSEKFFEADSKPFVANLLAYVLGQTPDDVESFEMFHRTDFLTDRKLYRKLEKVVNRMPTLEFQLIPLVMLCKGEMETSFVVRVRKLPQSNECVYLDMAFRKYKSFDQFLNSNRLPESMLWYPSGGLLQYEQDAPIPKIQIEMCENKMVHDHVSRIMHHFLQRGVELEQEELTRCSEKFFQADSKPFVANLLAYVLGQTPDDLKSFEMFHSPNLLTDRKLYGQLEKMVNLMPTLEFQLIPLVMVYNGEMQTAFVVRVRKLPQSNECVYVDLTLRTYKSFDQFLDSNRLPESMLWYPSGGLLQYEQDAPIPKIQIESRLIKRTGDIWKGIAIAGTGVATILAFTPLGLAVTAPLLFVTSVPTLGFSIADLVDGVKHERNTVVAQRSLALGFSLMTFASAGLTSICRLEKLRRMVPTDVLLKLEKAEQLLAASRRWVSVTEVTVSIIGNSNGWKEIPKEDWIRMGSLLCFAFRESFSDETAIRLYGLMQKNGVLKFFRELCPNALYETMRAKVCGPLFGNFLRFVVDYLQKGVEFKVDDGFTTITLFGHEFKFEMLFAVNWELMQSLLLVVQRSGHTIGQLFMGLRDSEPFTQDMLNDVLELLGLISRLGDISCTLADYIIIGPGHHYTLTPCDIDLSYYNAGFPMLQCYRG